MANLSKTCGMPAGRHIAAIKHTQTLTRQASPRLITPILLVVVVCLFSGAVQAQYGGGTGEPNDPYRIETAEDLNDIANHVEDFNKCFVLVADINLAEYTGAQFNVIGSVGNRFAGVFDGNGHTISNFTYTSTGKYHIGLFGYVAGESAEIRDLGLVSPNVDAGAGSGGAVGSLAGTLQGGTTTGCYVEGGSVSGWSGVGGLVGYNWGGAIFNCYSTGSLHGDSSVGGLVGENGGTISDCYALGTVSGSWEVGGLVGTNSDFGSISNCYATANVSGTGYVGGLVGENYFGAISNCYATGSVDGDVQTGGLVGTNHDTISNCDSAGSVSGNYDVGGLVGNNGVGTIINCYSTGSVSGYDTVGGLVGNNSSIGTIADCYSVGSVVGDSNVGGLVGYNDGMVSGSFWHIETSGRSNMCGGGSGSGCDDANGKTTAEMHDVNTFLAAGWDFVGEYENGPSDDWAEAPGGGYMILWWQLDPLPPLPTFSGGAGTESEPYLISNGTDLNRIGHNSRLMQAHFRLINDVNLSGLEIWSIGSNAFPFASVFDGNGHTVSNFTVDSNGTDYIGLFSCVDGQDTEIKDLGLMDPNVDAGTGDNVGSLVGSLWYGIVSGCYVEGGGVSGGGRVGGLVGQNSRNGTISNCYATGSVSGTYYVGGLVGVAYEGTISECHAAGDVSGDDSVGGLVGHNSYYGTISNCYSTGSVSGTGSYIGGLVGKIWKGTVSKSYSAGSVDGNDYTGGLVGYNWKGKISNCYSVGSVSGIQYIGGLVGINSGTIDNCYARGDATGSQSVGGLVGRNIAAIANCYSKGSVSGFQYVGGLVGKNSQGTVSLSFTISEVSGENRVGGLIGNNEGGKIYDSYSNGSVEGNERVGGLVGYNGRNNIISSSYSAAVVDGNTEVGGFVGWEYVLPNNVYEACFWHSTVNPSLVGVGSRSVPTVVGKSTSEMQTQSTFTDAGWDFVGEIVNGPNDIWDICEGTNYPKLTWQTPVLGDFGCPDGVEINDLGVLVEEWLRQILSADVWPDGGDGVVNFLDWAVFADGWQITNDIADLAVFTDQWLGRVLSADVAPDRGDDFVDFSDWAAFADAWKSTPESPNWNPKCDIAPEDGDDIVDMDDIVVFMEEWLRAGSYYHLIADIAPDGGDGIVNMLDYCVFADHWLAGL